MTAEAIHNGSEIASASLPRRVAVAELLACRYASRVRPAAWQDRRAGTDMIRTTDGEELILQSDGQQSPPQSGWVILLTSLEGPGYRWTLYGMPEGS